MTATERLRAMLDELGISWDNCGMHKKTHWTCGEVHHTAFEQGGKLYLQTSTGPVTPEQAIAATVGANNDEHSRTSAELSKRLREVYGLHAFTELFGFNWTDDSDWIWHDVACAMADAVDAVTARSEEPPYDELIEALRRDWDIDVSWDGLRKFWNIALTEEGMRKRDAATVGKDIERYDGSGRRGTVAILQGGRKPEEVLFVHEEGGVTHYLPEGAGTCKDLGGIGADDEVVFNCSECGCVLSVFDKDGRNNLCTSFVYDYPRFCPECGRKVIESKED